MDGNMGEMSLHSHVELAHSQDSRAMLHSRDLTAAFPRPSLEALSWAWNLITRAPHMTTAWQLWGTAGTPQPAVAAPTPHWHPSSPLMTNSTIIITIPACLWATSSAASLSCEKIEAWEETTIPLTEKTLVGTGSVSTVGKCRPGDRHAWLWHPGKSEWTQ